LALHQIVKGVEFIGLVSWKMAAYHTDARPIVTGRTG
jgi:hypothetical protein